MLTFDPDERITIDEAIQHDFFHDLHCPDDEPTSHPVAAFDFDFEKYDLKIDEIKNEIKLGEMWTGGAKGLDDPIAMLN